MRPLVPTWSARGLTVDKFDGVPKRPGEVVRASRLFAADRRRETLSNGPTVHSEVPDRLAQRESDGLVCLVLQRIDETLGSRLRGIDASQRVGRLATNVPGRIRGQQLHQSSSP